jgi:hypothetical protein
MSPSFTNGKRGKPYRYYVSAPLQQGRRQAYDPGIRRVPGPALEALLSEVLRRVAPASADDPLSALRRIEVHAQSLQLLCPVGLLASMRARLEPNETAVPDAADPALLRLTVPVRMRLHGGRTWVIGSLKPAARPNPTLIRALRAAHAMLRTDAAGLPILDTSPASPYLRRLVRLAFLAPDLQRAILAGRQPPGLTLESLMHVPMPMLWSEQEAMIHSLGVTGTPPDRANRST